MLAANPMTYLVRAYRAMLIDATVPSAADLAIATAYGCAVFVAGGLFFRHMKRGFARAVAHRSRDRKGAVAVCPTSPADANKKKGRRCRRLPWNNPSGSEPQKVTRNATCIRRATAAF